MKYELSHYFITQQLRIISLDIITIYIYIYQTNLLVYHYPV